jgi:hypothetical protein
MSNYSGRRPQPTPFGAIPWDHGIVFHYTTITAMPFIWDRYLEHSMTARLGGSSL